jgi:hypothetical protein
LLSNFQKEDGVVKIGDNSEVESEGTGTFTGYHLYKNGQQIDVTIHDVLLVPTLWVNLFSITKVTSKPNCKVICEDTLITVNSNKHKLHFTKILPHGKGKILATEFFTYSECASLVLKKTTYTDLHNKLGHPHKQAVIETAKHYGIELQTKREEPLCIECALSKIRNKSLGSNE